MQKEPDDPEREGKRVYLSSTDCGLSWKQHIVPENALGEATYSPETGLYMQCYPQEGRKTYPADYPDPEDGCYVLINRAGFDAPVEKIVRLYDKTLHFQKLPYYIASRNRWLIAAEYRYPAAEKFIVVAISDDDGDTWRVRELPHAPLFVPAPPHKGTRWQDYSCEPTVVELSDGTLLMHERTSLDFHYMRLSYDGGETWSDPQPSLFHGTLTMPVLHKLSDGKNPASSGATISHCPKWITRRSGRHSAAMKRPACGRMCSPIATSITSPYRRTTAGAGGASASCISTTCATASIFDPRAARPRATKSVHQGELLGAALRQGADLLRPERRRAQNDDLRSPVAL